MSSITFRMVLGITLALLASIVFARAFAGSDASTTVPLWFIPVLYVLARRYGFFVSVIGSLLCAFVFAHMLFDPTGSWHVQDAAARRSLLWMIIGAVSMSYFLTPPHSEGRDS